MRIHLHFLTEEECQTVGEEKKEEKGEEKGEEEAGWGFPSPSREPGKERGTNGGSQGIRVKNREDRRLCPAGPGTLTWSWAGAR